MEEIKYTITIYEDSQDAPSSLAFYSKEEYDEQKAKLQKYIENKEEFTIQKVVKPEHISSISYSHE